MVLSRIEKRKPRPYEHLVILDSEYYWSQRNLKEQLKKLYNVLLQHKQLSIKLFEFSPESRKEVWTELQEVDNRLREVRTQIFYITDELRLDNILRQKYPFYLD